VRDVVSRPGGLRSGARAAACLTALALAIAIAPSASPASVTFGDGLGVPDGLLTSASCSSSCTLAITVSPANLAQFRAPVSGVIVRWRIQAHASSVVQRVRPRVIAPVAGDTFTESLTEPFVGAGAGEAVEAPTMTGTFTFPAGLPVAAGDFLGLDTEGQPLWAVAPEEESIRAFEPALGESGAPAPGTHRPLALLVNADIAQPPTSGAVAACTPSGRFPVVVTPDPDPAVRARALWVRIDGGAALEIPVTGEPAVGEIVVPTGAHALEYWAEDSLGQSESDHHLASVLADLTPPSVIVSSDQGSMLYTVGQPATVTVAVRDSLSPLTADPSGSREPIPTTHPGRFEVVRRATDSCGSSATVSFSYRVLAPASIGRLRIRPARFRAARSGPVIAPAGSHSGAGMSYVDGREAVALITIERELAGTRSARGCLAAPRAPAPARRCIHFQEVAAFTRVDAAGHDELRLSGRTARGRLAPGAYRVRVGPDGPGGRGATAMFRILPG
jgi:hypothetical protein